jgi:hypothetical protein
LFFHDVWTLPSKLINYNFLLLLLNGKSLPSQMKKSEYYYFCQMAGATAAKLAPDWRKLALGWSSDFRFASPHHRIAGGNYARSVMMGAQAETREYKLPFSSLSCIMFLFVSYL